MLECVQTCVGYSDFLAHTIIHNKAVFDYLVISSTPDDKETQKLCEFYNVHCVTTDAFNTRNGEFCKGAGINAGLKMLKQTDWVIHMDCDVMLPPLTRQLLEQANLDKNCIYGIDRFMVKDFNEWNKFVTQPPLQHENSIFLHPNAFPIGVRVIPNSYDGYLPIGYWQMWQPSTTNVTRYPEQHTSAGRGDMLFAKQWARSRRHLIPEIIGYHLESEPAPMGTNWNGRKTAKFGVSSSTDEIGGE